MRALNVEELVRSWSIDAEGEFTYPHANRLDVIQYVGRRATFHIPRGYAVTYELHR
jgi:hypothetical protein